MAIEILGNYVVETYLDPDGNIKVFRGISNEETFQLALENAEILEISTDESGNVSARAIEPAQTKS